MKLAKRENDTSTKDIFYRTFFCSFFFFLLPRNSSPANRGNLPLSQLDLNCNGKVLVDVFIFRWRCVPTERERERKKGAARWKREEVWRLFTSSLFFHLLFHSQYTYISHYSLSRHHRAAASWRERTWNIDKNVISKTMKEKKKTREKKAAFPFIYHSFSAFTFHVSSFRRALSHCSSSRSTEEHWCGGRIMTLANSSRKEDCKRVERDEKLMASLKFGTW